MGRRRVRAAVWKIFLPNPQALTTSAGMDADTLLARQRLANEADRQAAQQREIDAQKFADLQTFRRLEKLSASEDVAWFIETFMQPLVDTEQTNANDVRLGAAKCFEHNQRRDFGKKLLHLLETKLEEYAAKSAI